jgi:hypothetical protein
VRGSDQQPRHIPIFSDASGSDGVSGTFFRFLHCLFIVGAA